MNTAKEAPPLLPPSADEVVHGKEVELLQYAKARTMGAQIKARVVELSVEVEDAEKALELLASALEKEARAHREEIESLEGRLRAEAREATQQSQAALAACLKETDRIVRLKETATRECKSIMDRAKERESAFARRASALEREAQLAKTRAKAAFDRGASDRRKKFLEKETQKIREITLKGLEPEIERLVAQHTRDLAQLDRNLHDAKSMLDHQAEATHLVRIETLRQAKATEDSQRLAQVRMQMLSISCQDQTNSEHSARAERYQKAIRSRAQNTATLRNELEAATRRDNELRTQRREEAKQDSQRRLDNAKAKLERDRKECILKTYLPARSAVKAVLQSEVERYAQVAQSEYEARLTHEIEVKSRALKKARDTKIDTRIRELEASAMAREHDQREKARSQRAVLKSQQLEALAEARTKRAEWLDKRLALLSQLQALRDKRQALSETKKDLQLNLDKLESQVRPKRRDSVALDKKLQARIDQHRQARHTATIRFQDAHTAARAALDAKMIEAQRKDQKHHRNKQDTQAKHQTVLAHRDDQVKQHLAQLDTEINQIKDALATEELRHTHLAKLLRSYSRPRPTSNSIANEETKPNRTGSTPNTIKQRSNSSTSNRRGGHANDADPKRPPFSTLGKPLLSSPSRR